MESSDTNPSPSAAPSAPSRSSNSVPVGSRHVSGGSAKARRVMNHYLTELLEILEKSRVSHYQPEEIPGHPDEYIRHLSRRVIGQAMMDALRVGRGYKAIRKSAFNFLVSQKPAESKLRAFWGAAAGIDPDYIRRKAILGVLRRARTSGVSTRSELWSRLDSVLREPEGSSRAYSGNSKDPGQ